MPRIALVKDEKLLSVMVELAVLTSARTRLDTDPAGFQADKKLSKEQMKVLLDSSHPVAFDAVVNVQTTPNGKDGRD